MFRRFLESYIEVCNNIVTESANSVLMFEAGEQAAANLKYERIEDCVIEFEKDNIVMSIERSENKVLFRVKGIVYDKKCKYCDILRGFFGELARKHIDKKYYCKKRGECSLEGANECVFIAEMIE
ncbi:Uncharacterised protein [uncultured archaeon]|nr:Uncharacterised protein [uncultured archaeon]